MLDWDGIKLWIYIIVGIYCLVEIIKEHNYKWQYIVWLLLLVLTIVAGAFEEELGFFSKVLKFLTDGGLLLVFFLRA